MAFLACSQGVTVSGQPVNGRSRVLEIELDRDSLMVEAETKLKGDHGRVAKPA
jgi:hypothetical protein